MGRSGGAKKGSSENSDLNEGRSIVSSMSSDDIRTLLTNLEKFTSITDNSRVPARTAKIKWEEVAFPNFDEEACRVAWIYLQENRRRHRNMWEILTEVKESLKSEKAFRKKMIENAPDYPGRPQGSAGPLSLYVNEKYRELCESGKKGDHFEYITFYRNAIIAYKKLPAEEQKVWEDKVDELIEKYNKDVAKFYKDNPGFEKDMPKPKAKASRSRGETPGKTLGQYSDAPQPPQNPVSTFIQSKLDGKESPPDEEELPQLKEKYSKKYQKLSDSKKGKWISKVIKKVEDYYAAVEEYQVENPQYQSKFKISSILNKTELTLWEEFQEKPVKPPSTPNLFFAQELEESGELESCTDSDEKNDLVETKWNALGWYDKESYKLKVAAAEVEYLKNVSQYLGALPEFLRPILIMNLDKKTRSNLEKAEEIGAKVSPSKESSKRKSKATKNTVEKGQGKIVTPPATPSKGKAGKGNKKTNSQDVGVIPPPTPRSNKSSKKVSNSYSQDDDVTYPPISPSKWKRLPNSYSQDDDVTSPPISPSKRKRLSNSDSQDFYDDDLEEEEEEEEESSPKSSKKKKHRATKSQVEAEDDKTIRSSNKKSKKKHEEEEDEEDGQMTAVSELAKKLNQQEAKRVVLPKTPPTVSKKNTRKRGFH